jgi:hypothetical protein
MAVFVILFIVISIITIGIIYYTNKQSTVSTTTSCPSDYALVNSICYQCPLGSSQKYQGLQTNVTGCKCMPNYVWDFNTYMCVACPTGSSPLNKGINTNVLGCRCPTGHTWFNSSCVQCLGGSDYNHRGPNTNITGCYCMNGYMWSGTTCIKDNTGSSLVGPPYVQPGPYMSELVTLPGNYQVTYYGCYGVDSTLSIFKLTGNTSAPILRNDGSNFLTKCATLSAYLGYNIFTIEAGNTCRVANSLTDVITLGEIDQCNIKDVNMDLPIGGSNAISVYGMTNEVKSAICAPRPIDIGSGNFIMFYGCYRLPSTIGGVQYTTPSSPMGVVYNAYFACLQNYSFMAIKGTNSLYLENSISAFNVVVATDRILGLQGVMDSQGLNMGSINSLAIYGIPSTTTRFIMEQYGILNGVKPPMTYYGCFNDDSARDPFSTGKTGRVPTVSSITACAKLAACSGYAYFGIEAGQECRFSNSLAQLTKLNRAYNCNNGLGGSMSFDAYSIPSDSYNLLRQSC